MENEDEERKRIAAEWTPIGRLKAEGALETIPYKESEHYIKGELSDIYLKINDILKIYIDMPEHYYSIISLWIIGTYLHDVFETFPLLFINATKGSGKSRLLRLIASLSKNGKMVLDLKEAVLFRTAKGSTICIDEFENVGKKENSTIRTLINAAYKKGNAVERMRKVVEKGQEKQVVERFDLYTSVAIANIWGMEDVLSDRCLTLILEKSSDISRTRLIEDFETNKNILAIKTKLNELQCSLCSVVSKKHLGDSWNDYVLLQKTTLTQYNTYTTTTTLTTPMNEDLNTFMKIYSMGIDGRNLELFFPILIISKFMGDELLDEILAIGKKIIEEKKAEEYAESKDVSLIDFISRKDMWRGSFISVHDLTKEFRMVTTEDIDEERWVNPKWVGRALKRSKLIIQKRRVGKGIEVILDIDKAKNQLKRFKEVPPNE